LKYRLWRAYYVKKIGTWKYYFKNGRIQSAGRYVNDMISGGWNAYYFTGGGSRFLTTTKNQSLNARSAVKMFKSSIMKDFKKYYILPVPPEEVYLALTNPLTIELWSGEKAEMSTEPGTEFSLWDGSIVGRNLEFESGKKIVQQWYFGEQQEPSIVTIRLHADPRGTSVEVRHTNIPDSDYKDIVEGWNDVYFSSLRDFY
jgi:activator of HSP90 ATPase